MKFNVKTNGIFISISQCGIVLQEIGITRAGFIRRIQYGKGWPSLKNLLKTRIRIKKQLIDYEI